MVESAIPQNSLETIRHVIDAVKLDVRARSWLLTGSVARGTALPESDVDLIAIVDPGYPSAFRCLKIGQREVEIHIDTISALIEKLRNKPSLCYGLEKLIWVAGDPDVVVPIQKASQAILAAYTVPPGCVEGLVHWIHSARTKVFAAMSAGNSMKAGFVVATTTWTACELLWAINRKPVPSNGQLLELAASLIHRPRQFEQMMQHLSIGPHDQRIAAFLELSAWLIDAAAMAGGNIVS